MSAIEKYSSQIGEDFDKDLIHEFRLSIKSLRSLLRLSASRSNGVKARLPKKLKRLFDIAGAIRESELEKELLIKTHINVPDYFEFLDNKIAEQKSEWTKHFSRKVMIRARKKIKGYKYKALNSETLNNFVSANLSSLSTLASAPPDEKVHDVRKNLKDVLNIIKLLNVKKLGSVGLSGQPAITELQKLAEIIGNYNDKRVMLEHITAFQLHDVNDNEMAAIKQFEQTEKKKLKNEKGLLLGVVKHAASDKDQGTQPLAD